MSITFKEFLNELDDEPMVIDPEFVANNPRLQQARKAASSPAGQDRFQMMYKREVMRSPEQRRKQKMMKRAGDKAQKTGSQQDPSATGLSGDTQGVQGGEGSATGLSAGTRGVS